MMSDCRNDGGETGASREWREYVANLLGRRGLEDVEAWVEDPDVGIGGYGDIRLDALAEEFASIERAAEARGRAAERSDLLAWLRRTTNGTRACREWVAFDIERGEHVGAASGKLAP
jgi:hypothetical protein